MSVTIFDNDGFTMDQYTIVFEDGDIFGCSVNPFDPQGFGQFCGNVNDPGFEKWDTVNDYVQEAVQDKRMGLLTSLENVPEKVQQFIRQKQQ